MKKFLKNLCIVAVVFIILSCFTACGDDKVKLISWQSDDTISVSDKSELELEFDLNYQNPSAQKNKVINYLGVDFEATYNNSVKAPYYNSNYDQYIYKTTDTEYLFCINSSTNEVVQYSFFPYNYTTPAGKNQLTKEQCYQIAIDKLNSIDNNGMYTLVDEKTRDIYGGLYVFTFVRNISNLKSADEVYISINSYGEMFSIQWLMQNSLLGVTDINYNADEVNSAINLKVKELYDKNEVQYEIDEQIVVRLKDGTVGLECTLTVDTESEYDDRIKLFVEL